MFVVETVVSL